MIHHLRSAEDDRDRTGTGSRGGWVIEPSGFRTGLVIDPFGFRTGLVINPFGFRP